MANKRDVVYNFTANTGGLNAGVSEAIKLLDKLSKKTDALQPDKKLSAGEPALKRLKESLAEMSSTLDNLKSQMASVGKQDNLSKEASLINEQLKKMQSLFNNFDTYANQGSKGVSQITQGLYDANVVATELMNKLRVLAGGKTASISDTNTSAATEASARASDVSTTATKDKRAYTRTKNTAQKTTSVPTSEDVVINYQPNISGLKQGVSEAQKILKGLSDNDALKNSLAPLIAQVTTLQTMLRNSDPKALKDIPEAATAAENAVNTLLQIQKQYGSVTTLTTTQDQQFRTAIDSVRVSTINATQEVQKANMVAKGKTAAEREGIAAAFDAARSENQVKDSTQKTTQTLSDNTKELKKNATQSTKLAKINDTVNTAFARVKDAVNSVNSKLASLSKIFTTLSNGGQMLSRALSALSGITASTFAADSLQQAVNYVEILELFRVATKGATDQAIDFVNTMEYVYGMDPNSIMQSVGMFFQLSDAIDMSTKSAATLSMGLTKTAVDMASLFNKNVNDVVEDLTSGMQGMTRAVRKYGLDLRMTTLEATAATLGIKGQAETMSEADRQGLRYITIMRQSQNASGNFAKTIESVANQLRIFKEQMLGIIRNIGNLFMPWLQKTIYVLNGIAMALKTVLQYIAAFVIGFKPQTFEDTSDAASDAADSVSSIGTAATKASKQIKSALSIDELNILSDQASTAASGLSSDDVMDPKIAEAIDSIGFSMEKVKMKAVKLKEAILDLLGFSGNYELTFDFNKNQWNTDLKWSADQFEKNLIKKFPQWKKSITVIFSNWDEITAAFNRTWVAVKKGALTILEPITTAFKKAFTDTKVAVFIDDLPKKLDKVSQIIGQWAPLFAIGPQLFVQALEGIHWDKIITSISDLAAALSPFLSAFGKGVMNYFIDLINLIPGVAEVLSALISKIPAPAAEALGYALGILASGIMAMQAAFTAWKIIGPIASNFTKVIDAVSGSATGLAAAGELFTTAGTAITGFASSIAIALGISVGALALIVAAVAAAVILIIVYWDDIKYFFTVTVPGWWEDFKTLCINLWSNIAQGFKDLPGKIGYYLGFALGTIVKWVLDMIDTVKTEVPKIVNNIGTFFVELPSKIATWFVEVIPKVRQWASDMVTEVKKDVPEIINSIVDFFISLPGLILTAIETCGSILYDVGQFILGGIFKGILDIGASIKKFSDGFVQGFKDALGIHSPSTVMRDEVGINMGLGIAEGLLMAQKEINDAAQTLSDGVQKIFDGISYNPQIDYQALITKAAAAGDFVSAAKYEQQRNAKIQGEGLSYDQTYNFADLLEPTNAALSASNDFLASLDTSSLTSNGLLDFANKQDVLNTDVIQSALRDANTSIKDVAIAVRMHTDYTKSAIAQVLTTINDAATRIIASTDNIRIVVNNTYVTQMSAKAGGGMVSTGEMFIAREAGPELVGKVNGKTSVANNDQIVEAVSQGVYKAVTKAQADQGEHVTKVIIGGKDWDTFTYKSSKRGEVRVGAKPVKVGGK